MVEYNFKVLSSLLSSFSLLIKANVSIFDENGVSSNARNLNVVPFCRLIKEDVRSDCAITDKKAIETMRKQEKAFYYSCHFGLMEMIFKFNVDAKSSFFILIGPFRDPKKYNENIQHINEYCRLYKKDPKPLIRNYKKIPSFSVDKFEAISDMMNIIASYAKTTKLISSKDNFLENELNPYLDAHLSETVRVGDISKSLFVSVKQLERIVNLYASTTPKKYILKYKLDKARSDIEYGTMPLSSIAEKYGFEDYNYFVRLFKKFEGALPSKLRKKESGN